MAKPSRSKQPDFDPRELEDLIHTPAVGTGVGSHLVQSSHPSPSPAEHSLISKNTNLFGPANMATVVMFENQAKQVDLRIPATVETDLPTVVESEKGTTLPSPIPASSSAPLEIWITESGEIVPRSRVKRIRFAQDILNSAEESVYDNLWNSKFATRGEGDTFRVVQAGYDYLMKRTRLSKKTIQRIIDKLLAKDFIVIEIPADIYRRTATTYRVFGYRAVLDRQLAKGRQYAVKIGPGFLFARQIKTADSTSMVTLNLTTVVDKTTPTVVEVNPTTVVQGTTRTIDNNSKDTSTADLAHLRELLQETLGLIDDVALHTLVGDCRRRSPDCAIEEIAYVVNQKLGLTKNIHNPVGFVLKAVPLYFDNDGHIPVRKLLKQRAQQALDQWQETFRFWTAIAENPQIPEDERKEARTMIDGLGPAPTVHSTSV